MLLVEGMHVTFLSTSSWGIRTINSEKKQLLQSKKNILLIYISFQVNSEILRQNLERIVGSDDSTFSGIDLATLIRNKYGRSYDIQLIKKVGYPFMEVPMLFVAIMEEQ